MSEISKIISRQKATESEKARFVALYSDVYRYGIPDKYADLKENDNSGKPARQGIYDSTFETAVDGFTYTIQNIMFPVNEPWIGFEAGYMFGSGEENQDARDEANRRLATLSENLNIWKDICGLDNAITSCLYDLAAGQMFLLIIEGNDEFPIVFIPIPFREITMVRNKRGVAESFFRNLKYKFKDIARIWLNAEFSYTKDEAEKEIPLLESCEFDYEKSVWKYMVIRLDTKSPILEREFKTSPFCEMPWVLTPGETYGRGPGLKAVDDFKTLNKMVEYALRIESCKVPFFTGKREEGWADITIEPMTIIPVESNSREDPSLQSVSITDQNADRQFKIEDLKMTINRIMFNMVVPNTRGQITATEYTDRRNELTKRFMNSYGHAVRFQKDIIKRMIEILQRAGLFPIEFDVEMFNGFGAKLKMNTELARRLDFEKVQEKMGAFGLLQNFDPTNQLAARYIKTDVEIPKILKAMGIGPDGIRSTNELAEYDRMAAENAEAGHQRAVQEDIGISNAKEAGKAQAKVAANA